MSESYVVPRRVNATNIREYLWPQKAFGCRSPHRRWIYYLLKRLFIASCIPGLWEDLGCPFQAWPAFLSHVFFSCGPISPRRCWLEHRRSKDAVCWCPCHLTEKKQGLGAWFIFFVCVRLKRFPMISCSFGYGICGRLCVLYAFPFLDTLTLPSVIWNSPFKSTAGTRSSNFRWGSIILSAFQLNCMHSELEWSQRFYSEFWNSSQLQALEIRISTGVL